MPPRLVVLGSSNTDMIVQVPRMPRAGETVLGGRFSTSPGGKGANQAVAAARVGGAVAFIARVGHDAFGLQAIEGYRAEGIDVTHVSRDPAVPTGVAFIVVDEQGENAIAVASGANLALTERDVRELSGVLSDASLLLLQLEVPLPAVRAAAAITAAAGRTVILNPAPAQSLDDDLLRHVTYLTPNETELEMLTGIPATDEGSLREASRLLHARGVRTVITTLGSRGAFVSAPGLTRLIEGFPVAVVDTTAAGDVFNGAFAVALLEQRSLPDAVRFANAAGALSVTKLGAQPSAPRRAEVDALLAGR